VISGEIQILLTVSRIIALSIKFNFAYWSGDSILVLRYFSKKIDKFKISNKQ
jgi:hypothetical protein